YSGFELIENVPLKPGSEEYLHSEKYQIRVRDWSAAHNINADVALLNRMRRTIPALQRYANLTFHPSENEQILFYRKAGAEGPTDPDVLVAVNLDPTAAQSTMVHVPLEDMGIPP